MLRTTREVTTSRRPEQSVVSDWANGTSSRPTPHPSLYHISLLQQDHNSVNQRRSHWFKRSEGWERVTADKVGPAHSFVM